LTARVKSAAYISLEMTLPRALADEAAGMVSAFGALGCETRNLRGRSAGKPALSELRAYFHRLSPSAARRITRVLTGAGLLSGDHEVRINRLVDPGWATMWQKRFEPLRLGRRCLIVPPWKPASMKGRESIVIQPGQAFGTGHHGSTRGALRLIEELFQSHRFRRVLDVGTGSGILAIAMRKWGAQEVIAIDIDPVALENAGENARLNHLNKSIRFSAAPVASIRGRFDLIAANILSSVLVPMAAALKQRLRPGGFLVLAGILAREVDTVAAAYAPELKLIRIRAERTWRALLFER